VALLFAITNLKSLPFVWTFRFFHAAFLHSFRPKSIPKPLSASDSFPLFLPVITSTRAPVLECDFNIHKSNSTYFADIDVSRAHLIALLGAPGLKAYHDRQRKGEEKRLLIALGGVACFFLKEIKPYEPYEMWTRVLAWDQKWIYTVTHFVRKGAVKPKGLLMQPNGLGWWSSLMSPKKGKAEKAVESEGSVNGAEKKDVFAFALSKYVVKSGRQTIPPELVFQRCGALPAKPENSEPSPTSTIEDSGLIEQSMANGADTPATPESFDEAVQSSLTPSEEGEKGWTWDMIEKERQRGMGIGRLMAQMDSLKDEFTGNSKPALGQYRDLLWA
jgi:hypothetical protein